VEVGIGLPGHAPWNDGRDLLEWARRADVLGFSTLAVSDRLLWPTPEPIVALAAAAGATTRIGLLTSVLLAPLRTNQVLFAKELTTLDRLAGPGRLHVGLAAGFRDDDFVASGVDLAERGQRMKELLATLAHEWRGASGTKLAPATPGGPPLLFGGDSDAALERIATVGDGWVAGTTTPDDIEAFLPRLRQRWHDHGRQGQPRVVASVMVALGPDAHDAVQRAIVPYYAFAGEDYGRQGVDAALTTAEQIHDTITGFEAAGCDELILTGNDPNPGQVDLLADALALPRT
jgi:alkanesulfonate monooxygenase SsuD/methylene tetrahydromethanopterin reductase-like flavin-dependent oxidoreductase (luciferase family)